MGQKTNTQKSTLSRALFCRCTCNPHIRAFNRACPPPPRPPSRHQYHLSISNVHLDAQTKQNTEPETQGLPPLWTPRVASLFLTDIREGSGPVARRQTAVPTEKASQGRRTPAGGLYPPARAPRSRSSAPSPSPLLPAIPVAAAATSAETVTGAGDVAVDFLASGSVVRNLATVTVVGFGAAGIFRLAVAVIVIVVVVVVLVVVGDARKPGRQR